MAILVVHCDLNRSDVKSHKSRQSVLTKEIEKGRRPEQISSNGTTFFVQTPERALDFTKRLVDRCGISKEKDRITVVDVSQGKVYISGDFDAEIKAKFPFLVEEWGV